jgi:hypothetical protein
MRSGWTKQNADTNRTDVVTRNRSMKRGITPNNFMFLLPSPSGQDNDNDAQVSSLMVVSDLDDDKFDDESITPSHQQ